MRTLRPSDWLLLTVLAILVLGVAYLLYREFTAPTVSSNPATLLDLYPDPIQLPDTQSFLPPLEHRGAKYMFEPQASYSITGILVSKRQYSGTGINWLSPWDYALVWGAAIHLLDKVRFKQVVRFCLFQTKGSDPVDPVFMGRHLSNNHLIPSTSNLRRALGRAKKGQIVKLEGYLVNVKTIRKARLEGTWNSSLVRTDDGNGACEIIYLTRLQIGEQVYE